MFSRSWTSTIFVLTLLFTGLTTADVDTVSNRFPGGTSFVFKLHHHRHAYKHANILLRRENMRLARHALSPSTNVTGESTFLYKRLLSDGDSHDYLIRGADEDQLKNTLMRLRKRKLLYSTFENGIDQPTGHSSKSQRSSTFLTQNKPLNDVLPLIEDPLGRETSFTYPAKAGLGACIYMLDSGVNHHPTFENRLVDFKNYVPGEPIQDCLGHGTNTASIAGSRDYGVAKKATIYNVKVIDKNNNLDYSRVFEAFSDIFQANHKCRVKIINMSFGGGSSSSYIDTIFKKARDAGFILVASAGNSHDDACNNPVAGSPYVISVGNVDRDLSLCSNSSYGRCVNVFSYGVDIAGANFDGSWQPSLYTGTSQAAPHVSGMMALYFTEYPVKPTDRAIGAILKYKTAEIVRNPPPQTTNRLLLLKF